MKNKPMLYGATSQGNMLPVTAQWFEELKVDSPGPRFHHLVLVDHGMGSLVCGVVRLVGLSSWLI